MEKTFSQTFLYSQYPGVDEKAFKFIMNAERINTSSAEFADILFDIKRRRISDKFTKIINSPNVVIGINEAGHLDKPLRVFFAHDVKDNKKPKVFIDVTDYIKYKDGVYICNNIDVVISYIIAGIVHFIYGIQPIRLINNNSVVLDGGEAFMRCFAYVIDRMYKISSVSQLKKRLDYMAALYYVICILGKDPESSSTRNYAIKISDIMQKEAQLVDIMLKKEDFKDISTFVDAVGRVFKLKDIKLDSVVSLWGHAFGNGTLFALEYFPSFSMMMTNTYIGANIDNQLVIEKVCSSSQIKTFGDTIIKIGDSVS